jgi:hypothetical protein
VEPARRKRKPESTCSPAASVWSWSSIVPLVGRITCAVSKTFRAEVTASPRPRHDVAAAEMWRAPARHELCHIATFVTSRLSCSRRSLDACP